MSLLHTLKGVFTREPAATAPATPAASPPPIVVPEINPAEFIAARNNGSAALLLDCREPWEVRQARAPGSLHIPMNDIPARLHELDLTRPIVVICAHGNRSHGVAGYLIEQGFAASNLTGGIARWRAAGGPIESEHARG